MKRMRHFLAAASLAIPCTASATSNDLTPLPNLSGTWARAQVTSALVDVPVLGELSSRTLAVTLLRVRQDGAELTLDEEVCRLTTQAPTRLVTTAYPPAFIQAVSGNRRRGRLELDGSQIRYLEPKQAFWRGMRPDADIRGPLPTSGRDPRVDDVDRDGQPGLTVQVGGLIDGEIFLVQRSWSELTGVVRSQNQIEGQVEWDSEEQILGASASILTSAPDKRPDPKRGRSFFRMRRVPSSATCGEVLARRHRLFGL